MCDHTKKSLCKEMGAEQTHRPNVWIGGRQTRNKTIHRQDSSPTLHFDTVPQHFWRQFLDTFVIIYFKKYSPYNLYRYLSEMAEVN